ncbi:TM0106 family RecB-like putative nuclease [Candidatus Woesearchaeota archaeon]|nr:MAG: TM0106 family RecB-like putative nuclease [Candidatus Woesearchaeota archaeon]
MFDLASSYMDVFSLCTQNKSNFTITSGMFSRYLKSPFLVWCDAHAPERERDPPNAFLQLLFSRSAKIRSKACKSAKAVDVQSGSIKDVFKSVLDACRKGELAIANAPLIFWPEGLQGSADVLERSEGFSVFGDYQYKVKLVKGAKRIKRDYCLQAAFNSYILSLIQGSEPDSFVIVNRDGKEVEFVYEDYKKDVVEAISSIREILSGKRVSPCVKDASWPWESYIVKCALKSRDVSLIPHVGRSLKRQLAQKGIRTIDQLAEFDGELDVPDMIRRRIIASARAWKLGEPVLMEKPCIPQSSCELYVDFEGTDEVPTAKGLAKTDYLIGVLVCKGGKSEYLSFVSRDLDGEESIFRSFVRLALENEGPIYHYGGHELFRIKTLGKKYSVDVSSIVARMIDVLDVLKQSFALPTISLSLKDVAQYLGFNWRGTASAQDSIVLFLEFLKSKDESVLSRIVDYNEDDVRATRVVKEFLSKAV